MPYQPKFRPRKNEIIWLKPNKDFAEKLWAAYSDPKKALIGVVDYYSKTEWYEILKVFHLYGTIQIAPARGPAHFVDEQMELANVHPRKVMEIIKIWKNQEEGGLRL